MLARRLERPADQRLVESVRRVAEAAHRVERELVAVADEPHRGAEAALGRAREHVQVIGADVCLVDAHAHREPEHAPLARAPVPLELVNLELECGVDRSALADRDLPSPALDAVHRLAQLADLAALERELERIHERLLAGADRVEPEVGVGGQMALRRAPHHHLPPARAREIEEARQHRGRLIAGRHRVRGDDRGAADHPVGEHAPAANWSALSGRRMNGESESSPWRSTIAFAARYS